MFTKDRWLSGCFPFLTVLIGLSLPVLAQTHDEDVNQRLDKIQIEIDALRLSHPATVVLAPVAGLGNCPTTVNTAVACLPLSFASDPNTPPLVLNLNSVTTPTVQGGSLVNDLFTPAVGFSGLDETGYVVCNSAGLCTPGTIHMPVTAPSGRPVDLAAAAAFVPVAGQWAEVPNSSILPHLKQEDGSPLCAQIRCPASLNMIIAWNGMAYDPVEHYWRIGPSGGHGAYGGNELLRYDLRLAGASNAWVRETEPEHLTGPEKFPNCPWPATGAPAFHTYSGNHIQAGRMAVFGSVAFCAAGHTDPPFFDEVWYFNLTTKQWQYYPSLQPYARFARTDLMDNGNLVAFSERRIAEIDPSGNIVRELDSNQLAGFSYGTGVYLNDWFYMWTPFGFKRLSTLPANFGTVESLAPMQTHGRSAVDVHDPTGRLVYYNGDDAIAIYDPVAASWETRAAAGPPQFVDHLGEGRIYTRWEYVPELDVFMLLTHTSPSVWFYKL